MTDFTELLSETGQGLAVFLTAIDHPFLIISILIFGMLIVLALISLIVRAMKKSFA